MIYNYNTLKITQQYTIHFYMCHISQCLQFTTTPNDLNPRRSVMGNTKSPIRINSYWYSNRIDDSIIRL